MKEHKHAEVLRAIADGKKVEYYNKNNKTWCEIAFVNPLNYPDLEWRVNPNPPIEKEMGIQLDNDNYPMGFTGVPNVRFTFDPDTRLPIKVELI